MELNQAIELIRTPHLINTMPQAWADLGAGSGLFARALAHLVGKDSTIYAVDKNASELQQIQAPIYVSIQAVKADFVNDVLNFSGLTGILMANSLHYVKDQQAFIHKMKPFFAADGRFLIVEYDTDNANPWVPYPLSFTSLTRLFKQAGYTTIEKISEAPSIYNNNNIYTAWIE